jgi:hypothetical protein
MVDATSALDLIGQSVALSEKRPLGVVMVQRNSQFECAHLLLEVV